MATDSLRLKRTIEPASTVRSRLSRLWWRDYARPHTRFQTMSADGVSLRGIHLRSGGEILFIYCHGFAANKNYTGVPRFVEMLAAEREADAIAFDFRGHGESEGATTLGEREPLDLDAIVSYARQFNYRHIILVGSSMGGAVSIRYAVESPDIAGVATVGAYARAEFTRFASLSINLYRLPIAPAIVHAVRQCRIESLSPSTAPVDVVDQLSPRPLLLFHGALDPLVPVQHARELYAKARAPKDLIVIPRGSHDIPNLNRHTRDRIRDWVKREIG